MAITKERIISAVFKQVGLSRRASIEAVEKILDILKKTLASEEDVLVSGFGKFIVRLKHARRGRNPKTKEAMELRARRVIVFHISQILRKKLNGEEVVDVADDENYGSAAKNRIMDE